MGTSHIMLQVSLGSHQKCQPGRACLRPQESLHTSARMFLIAPGSSSLSPDGLPYRCLGFNCHGSTLSQSSAGVDMCCQPAVAYTQVCADQGTALFGFGCQRLLSGMRYGQLSFVYVTLRKKKRADVHRQHFLSDSEHLMLPVSQACGWSLQERPSPQICKQFGWFLELVLFAH